jgi:ComF family protein
MLASLATAVLDLVYPAHCCNCDREGSVLCQRCRCEIDYYFLPVKIQLDPLWIDEYLVVAHLEGIIRQVVHQLKYASVTAYANVIGELLFHSCEWPTVDVVTSVPLHPHRLGQRGFNQAELIARTFAQLAGIPYVELLQRTMDTPHQAQQLTRADREHNITDYFSILPGIDAGASLVGKNSILIDDVCTTGITLNHCAKVLKASGCKRVTAITLAHGR